MAIFQTKEFLHIAGISTMERFYGTWKFVSYENFDDYLKGSQCISIIPNPTPRIALVVSWFVHMTHIMYESVRVRYSSI